MRTVCDLIKGDFYKKFTLSLRHYGAINNVLLVVVVAHHLANFALLSKIAKYLNDVTNFLFLYHGRES